VVVELAQRQLGVGRKLDVEAHWCDQSRLVMVSRVASSSAEGQLNWSAGVGLVIRDQPSCLGRSVRARQVATL
jgi:hypothetical protein